MDILVSVLAVLAGVAGIVGSIVPILPGPPVSWIGLLLLYFWGGTNGAGERMSTATLLVWLAIVIAVVVIDYLVPIYFTKLTGGSRYASRGAMAGLVVGLLAPPVGMIAGSFLGAFLAELIYAGKGAGGALKSAFGSFLGFLAGTGMKLVTAGVMMYYIIVYL
ncbi:MAG: DUF456 domain-containing protein [Clostridium sp.]|nr:DUF456 domain-containing protein [Bacteroides sp.]MCM1198403.1 DUF456 domain-containing protein [Clostridium sp.]